MYFAGRAVIAAIVAGIAHVSAKRASSLVSEGSDVTITFGPTIYAGTSTQEIVKFSTTTFPGNDPPNQTGDGLFLWPGLTNDGTSDLIQSVVGSYPPGRSECTGTNVDTTWCVSSEVYVPGANGNAQQLVGALTTLEPKPANGISITYTLTDKTQYTWTQVVHDATTGQELATFTQNSGPMKIFEASVECQECSNTISTQTYVNTTVTLAAAEPNWKSLVSASGGATFTTPTTSDGGVTWNIGTITFPAQA